MSILEVNASSARSGAHLTKLIGEATVSQRVAWRSAAAPKRALLPRNVSVTQCDGPRRLPLHCTAALKRPRPPLISSVCTHHAATSDSVCHCTRRVALHGCL